MNRGNLPVLFIGPGIAGNGEQRQGQGRGGGRCHARRNAYHQVPKRRHTAPQIEWMSPLRTLRYADAVEQAINLVKPLPRAISTA